jgi:hypothetical protein
MAAADFTAIEYVLDREVDIDTLRLAGNFDAVARGSKIHSTAGCADCGSWCKHESMSGYICCML